MVDWDVVMKDKGAERCSVRRSVVCGGKSEDKEKHEIRIT
jgi:hypothetical protein